MNPELTRLADIADQSLYAAGANASTVRYSFEIFARHLRGDSILELGAAEGAYELFLEATAKRAGTYTGARIADFQAVQIKVGRARCLIDSARHLLRQSALELQAAAERNDIPDLDTKLRFRAHSACAVSQAREAVEILWSCYGAQGLYTRDPLKRYLRDEYWAEIGRKL